MPTEDPLPDPLYFTGPDDAPEEMKKISAIVPDIVRRAVLTGVGALFMTEEGIRNLAGQLKLPKEVLAFILSQAEKTKDELARIVSDELRRFLQSEKLREEFVKLLAGMTMEINAQVRLVPSERKAGEHHPKVTVSELSTRVKKRQKKE